MSVCTSERGRGRGSDSYCDDFAYDATAANDDFAVVVARVAIANANLDVVVVDAALAIDPIIDASHP